MVMVKVIWKLCEAYNVEMCGKIEIVTELDLENYVTWIRNIFHKWGNK